MNTSPNKSFRLTKRYSQQTGVTLLLAMVLALVLVTISAHVYLTVSDRYHYTSQATGWDEAYSAAEAGADLAVNALKNGTWTGLKDASGNSVSWQNASASPVTVASGLPAAGTGLNTLKMTMAHATTTGITEGTPISAVNVQIDAPSSMQYSNPAKNTWYRVISRGTAGVPGMKRVGLEPNLLCTDGTRLSASSMLRKFNLLSDITGGLISAPQVSRTIEVIVKGPALSYSGVLMQSSIAMSGGSYIDSFDSSDPTKSTNGLYASSKSQSNATVGTANTGGNSTDLTGGKISGNFSYSGAAPKSGSLTSSHVTGTVSSSFSYTFPTVSSPLGNPVWNNPQPSSSTLTQSTGNLTAGPAGSPTYYKFSSANLSGGLVNIVNPNPGQPAEIQIWVTGQFQMSGGAVISQDPSVNVTYYIEGQVNLSGGSMDNKSSLASNLTIYGVTPASGFQQFQMSGGSTFIGKVIAPAYDINYSGGSGFSGAFIGHSLQMSGGAGLHVDTAASGGSTTGSYSVASWFERTR